MDRDIACKHYQPPKVVVAKRKELQMADLVSGNLKEEEVLTRFSYCI
jgi:hypothetical protein